MPRKAPLPECSELDRKILEQWAHSRTEESRLVERAKIILKCLRGERVLSIARDLKVRPNTVIEWRRRFEKQGVQGLKDRPRTGKPLHYEAEFRNKVLKTLELPPPSVQQLQNILLHQYTQYGACCVKRVYALAVNEVGV